MNWVVMGVEPAIGPRMLAPAEALLARTLNLASFGLAEVAIGPGPSHTLQQPSGHVLGRAPTRPLRGTGC